MLSAVALLGMTVASYGANTVEKVEVNENLLIEEIQMIESSDPCSDCYHTFSINYNNTLLKTERILQVMLDVWETCVEENCSN